MHQSLEGSISAKNNYIAFLTIHCKFWDIIYRSSVDVAYRKCNKIIIINERKYPQFDMSDFVSLLNAIKMYM